MTRPVRLVVPLLLVLLGGLSGTLPSRAQEGSSSRLMFADTTLLRDTLGIRFGRLFTLADSLRMTPDTLRALAIRYRFAPERLVELADSMAVPVDSVGVVLLRARFNPLLGGERSNSFTYNTTYNIQQTRSAWSNSSDYNLVAGPLFLRNTTTIQIDRLESSRIITKRQVREANTEVGWRLAPDYSLGARAVLNRFDSDDPGNLNSSSEARNDYQLSARTQQRPTPELSSEFNMFAGLLDLNSAAQDKRGASGDLSGRVAYKRGKWLSHELAGSFNGNVSRTSGPTQPVALDTRDINQSLRGTLNLFQNARVGLQSSGNYRNVRVQTPGESGVVTEALTSNADADATLRMRLDNDRFLDATARVTQAEQVSGATRNETRRTSRTLGLNGRYSLFGTVLEGRFSNDVSNNRQPRITADGGYIEDAENRSVDASASRQLTERLSGRVSGSIGLSISRYGVVGSYPSPPVNRDNYRQSWRAEGIYTFSQRFNTGLVLDVSRTQTVNIDASSSSSNSVTRSYRADWRWTYRLLQGLTATQRNSLGASYNAYNYIEGADRLSLDFTTVTTLNAILTPRLTVNLNHSGRVQPGGSYNLNIDDGRYYFIQGDESRSFNLDAEIAYAPGPALALSLRPRYVGDERDGFIGGTPQPQNRSGTLTIDGQASLNVGVGSTGRLSGNIGRSYRGVRTTTYSQGVPQPSPRSEFDYWNGTLQFSWSL
jgi:hypothetical protein